MILEEEGVQRVHYSLDGSSCVSWSLGLEGAVADLIGAYKGTAHCGIFEDGESLALST